MAIIPTVHCKTMRKSLAFYTDVLGFERVTADDDIDDPSFVVLSRAGDRLFLSSHCGDGEFGQAIVVESEDVDREWSALRQRGLRPPGNPARGFADVEPPSRSTGKSNFFCSSSLAILAGKSKICSFASVPRASPQTLDLLKDTWLSHSLLDVHRRGRRIALDRLITFGHHAVRSGLTDPVRSLRYE